MVACVDSNDGPNILLLYRIVVVIQYSIYNIRLVYIIYISA